MRLIDADAFVQFLKDAVIRQKYENLKIDGLLTVADVIGAIISDLDGTSFDGFKNAPTIEPKPKWIPVSERLPEVGKEVLRTIKSFGWNGEEYRVVNIGIYDTNFGNIVAWMPLPSPYKEGAQE